MSDYFCPVPKPPKKSGQKRTKMNVRARKRIAQICEEKNLTRCEAKLSGCLGPAHAPAHKRKRVNYQTWEELADFNEWIAMCSHCGKVSEYDRKLLSDLFVRLRGSHD